MKHLTDRTKDEIYDQIDKAIKANDGEFEYAGGMSYADGVKTALEWILGSDEPPMDD